MCVQSTRGLGETMPGLTMAACPGSPLQMAREHGQRQVDTPLQAICGWWRAAVWVGREIVRGGHPGGRTPVRRVFDVLRRSRPTVRGQEDAGLTTALER